jgi:hypothetical protein
MSLSRRELFEPRAEADARILLLIDGFSKDGGALEGRVKLAKLDFFLRYPMYFARALRIRASTQAARDAADEADRSGKDIETRMIRFRYGPWDPAYFGILGRLVGMGLVELVNSQRTLAYRTTAVGHTVAEAIASTPEWGEIRGTVSLLRRYFDLTGSTLMKFIYQHFPEVKSTPMGQVL